MSDAGPARTDHYWVRVTCPGEHLTLITSAIRGHVDADLEVSASEGEAVVELVTTDPDQIRGLPALQLLDATVYVIELP